jgi:hypothetical protein
VSSENPPASAAGVRAGPGNPGREMETALIRGLCSRKSAPFLTIEIRLEFPKP